jgi:hypothetical protein
MAGAGWTLNTPIPRKYILGPAWVGLVLVGVATWGAVPFVWGFPASCFVIGFVVRLLDRRWPPEGVPFRSVAIWSGSAPLLRWVFFGSGATTVGASANTIALLGLGFLLGAAVADRVPVRTSKRAAV